MSEDNQMVLRAAIFDLGGTLIYHSKDTNELIKAGHKVMADYLVRKGFPVELHNVVKVCEEIYWAYSSFAEKSLIEVDAAVIYSAILYQLDIPDYSDMDLIRGAINGFYSPFVDDYKVFEDVEEVLSNLKERGLKLGLLSNNHSMDFHLRLLQKFDLETFFDSITVSSSLGMRKPHKGIFLHCLRMLGASNESSIFVGDNPVHDIEGARNAGIRCIWVRRKSYEDVAVKPDWVVESVWQAGEIITSLLS